jgi:hypothetical protein
MRVGKPFLLFYTMSAAGIIGLLLVEVATRVLFPAALPWRLQARLERERHNPTRPDSMFHHVGDGRFHLNFPPPSDSGLPRIMVVGDSFAMGAGVEKGERFGSLLQAHLGGRVAVDVLATSSYSPVIYRNIVRTALAANHYRAVTIFVDQTDPADDLIYQEELLDADSLQFNLNLMKERARAVDDAYGALLEQLGGWLNLRHFVVFNMLKPLSILSAFKPGDPHYRYVYLSAARTRLIQTFAQEPAVAESRQMEALLTMHLDQIVAMCREAQVPLFLAANPWEAQCSQEPKKGVRFLGPFPIENRLERLLNDRYGGLSGVYVVPLTQAFRAHQDPSSLFLKEATEIHWTAEGHGVAEHTLREILLAKSGGW